MINRIEQIYLITFRNQNVMKILNNCLYLVDNLINLIYHTSRLFLLADQYFNAVLVYNLKRC